MRFLGTAGLMMLAALPQAAMAQRPPAPPAPEEVPIFRGGVTVVTAPVTVRYESGNFVTDLKPSEFQVFDNGMPQTFTVELAETPLSLVILVCNSSRISTFLPEIRKVGSLFDAHVVGERGEAAVVTFDHLVQVAQGFTNDSDRLIKTFRDLKEGSSQSKLNDAMVRALTMLRDRPASRRKVIVVISEGRDFGSTTDAGYVLREAQIGGIAIYSVMLSATRAELTRQQPPPPPSPFPPGATGTYPGQPPTPTAEMQNRGSINFIPLIVDLVKGVKGIFVDNPLEVYAKGTGGADLHSFKNSAMQAAIGKIGSELHNQYLVTYRPNNLSELGYHRIDVIVGRPGTKAVTRPGYFLAGPVLPSDLPSPSSEARR
jgi:VWFA-related protein